jgi:alpha-tubulin suppressor-like RCC1 family protein
LLFQVFKYFILENGIVYGFGRNSGCQLGLGDTNNRDSPTEIILLRDLKINDIYCGFDFTIAISKG